MRTSQEIFFCAACFLGPPSSGKGTAAKHLSDNFGLPIITPGEIYKVLREEQSETGYLVRESLKDGGYCPDYLTNRIVLEETRKLVEAGAIGVLLDGYPRSLVQLQFMRDNLDVGLYLHTESPYENLEKFVTNRVQCPDCARVQSLLRPESLCLCPRTDGWHRRWDDTPEMFPKRYATYQALTSPIINAVEGLPEYSRYDCLADDNVLSLMCERVASAIQRHKSMV